MKKEYTNKVDIYSIGLVIFKLLNPSGESATKAKGTLDEDYMVCPNLLFQYLDVRGIDIRLCEIVKNCCQLFEKDRWSWEQLYQALNL